jgi:fatty-acyl-CoA synthase
VEGIMLNINLKNIVRYGLAFINLRSFFRFKTRSIFRRNRVFFIFEGKEYTYGETYEHSRRYARFFLSERKKRVDQGELGRKEKLSIGIYQENSPEFIFTIFGAAISNCMLFAVNTGFRGETLAKVVNQAGISLFIVDSATCDEVESAMAEITVFKKEDIFYSGPEEEADEKNLKSLRRAVEETVPEKLGRYTLPIANTDPFMIIYTSGMTGLPKGVPCTQIKLIGAGLVTNLRLKLRKDDRGYICMPLFHSNSVYIGVMTLMVAGGSFLLKRKFSASAFEQDMLENGVTYMNYVGQPLHYILLSLEKKYGSGEAVVKALAEHPDNKFRLAHGNGASAVDRRKLISYLGMEHVYEMYGSTEAPITTVNRPGDPVDSVGKVSKSLLIIKEDGSLCEPGEADEKGNLLNYEEAVGEISKQIKKDNVFFDGYYKNSKATDSKFRGGFYHSGDLGHVRIVNGKRYLFLMAVPMTGYARMERIFQPRTCLSTLRRYRGWSWPLLTALPARFPMKKSWWLSSS